MKPSPSTASTGARSAAGQTAADRDRDDQARPWWRFGMVWLVVGGPAIVVVASLATAVVAYRGADEVLVDTASARDVPTKPTARTPAMTARNHAATAAADQ